MFVEHPHFRGYYITGTGEVWSTRGGGFRELTPSKCRGSYLSQALVGPDGKVKQCRIHRLVLEVFEGVNKTLHINHKNGKKLDNRLENLEYCTAKENAQHAVASGLRDGAAKASSERAKRLYQGSGNPNAKLSDEQARELLALKGKMSGPKAAELFGIQNPAVYKLWNGKSFKHLERAFE
jgi:hypothetical protein